MKRLLPLLLALCLLLSACGGSEPALVARTHEDLTIGIPEDYIDLTGEEFAEGLDFVYGLDPIAINGMREEKFKFQALGLDLQRYGELLMAANNLSGTLEEKDGILMFSYEAKDFTYVVTLHETEKAFWTVQGYCPTENYNAVKNTLWQILSSAQI